MSSGRVNELINRKREVVRFDLIERIAEGLNMPNAARMMLGLALAGTRQAADLRPGRDVLSCTTLTVLAPTEHKQLS